MKKFWISYVCFTITLPFLFTLIHHDEGLLVMPYFLALFTAVGVLFGGFKLKFVVKALFLALISGVTAWMMTVAAGDPHYRTDFMVMFILLTIVMIVGCLVRTVAPASRYQFLLGFMAAVSATAMIIIPVFIGTLLPEKAPQIQRVGDRRSSWSSHDVYHPFGNALSPTTNEHTWTTNALAVPELKL